MIDKKLLVAALVSAGIAVPAGAQVATNVNVGVKADAGQVAGTVADTVNKAVDAAGETAATAQAAVDPGPVVPATAADVKADVKVYDPKGGLVGSVEEVNAEGAIVATGKSRVQLPTASFGKNNLGLVISVTRDELDAQAAAAASASADTKTQ